MLTRSSIEAYVGIAIAVLVTVFTLTWWIKAFLVLVLGFMVCDVSLHSPWMTKLSRTARWLVCLAALALVAMSSWSALHEQRAPENAPAATKALHGNGSASEVRQEHTKEDTKAQAVTPTPEAAPRRKAKEKPPAKAPQAKPEQPVSQSCPHGICIGGDNSGTAIVNNYGPPSPPPLQLNWTARDVVPSEKNEFSYEKEVTVTANIVFTPVAVAVVCDSDIAMIDDRLRSGGISFNVREGITADRKTAFVYFEGGAMSPRNPLIIRLWSPQPLNVLGVAQARIPGIND